MAKTDLSGLLTDAKIKAAYLCGFLNTGILAANSRAVDAQGGIRLWNSRKCHVPDEHKGENNTVSTEGVVPLIGYTDFINNMDEHRLHSVCDLLSTEQQLTLQEFYNKMKPTIDDMNSDVSKLFKSQKAALSWQQIDGNRQQRLVVDAANIVNSNLALFDCTEGNASRYVKTVLKSEAFIRRYVHLVATLQKDHKDCPAPIIESTKMDLIAFHLFVRCCKGPASDLALTKDALRGAFIGLGDVREAVKVLEEISKSDASKEEQSSYGIDEKTQQEALETLRKQVDSIEEQMCEVQMAVEGLDDDLEFLKTQIIPAPHRLYIGAYVDKHFDYSTTKLPRDEVLKAFGSLVTQAINEKGMRATLGHDGQRNIYDDRIHLDFFDDCLANKFENKLAEELVRFEAAAARERNAHARIFFEKAVDREDEAELFKDMTDSKLSDAGDDPVERARVLHDRRRSFCFVFKRELSVRDKASCGYTLEEVYQQAKKTYIQQRLDKKEKEEQKKRRREEKNAAAAAKKKARK